MLRCAALFTLALALPAQGDPAEGPAEGPAENERTAPPPAKGSPEALALAAKMRAFSGGAEAWAKVETLYFTFRSIDRIFWDRKLEMVRAETLRGRRKDESWAPWTSAVYDLRLEQDVFKGGDGELPGMQAFLSAKDKWRNHSFWLLAPLMALDPGTELSIDDADPDDAEGIQRLRLVSDTVGLAPGNRIVFHIETATGKPVRLDYQRRDGDPVLSWTFERWTRVGDLNLALHHNPIGPGVPLHLVDVHVNVQGPRGVWSHRGRVLQRMFQPEPHGPSPEPPASVVPHRQGQTGGK